MICEIISNDEEEDGIEIEGKESIAEFRASVPFAFPKCIPEGESLSSGVWIMMLDSPSGFEALETYADLIVEYNLIKLWPHEVPHGWNSWNNPLDEHREYCYVTQINEEIILENLDIAVDKLKRFGLLYWQLAVVER